MKIDIKKILCKSIMALMVIPFFLVNSVPVHADYDFNYTPIPYWSLGAYQYWENVGYSHTIEVSWSKNTTVDSSATLGTGHTEIYLGQAAGSGWAGTISGHVGSTAHELKCSPTSTDGNTNTTYTCRVIGGGTNYGLHEDIHFQTVQISGVIAEGPRPINMTSTFHEAGSDYYGYSAFWSETSNYVHDTEYVANHAFHLNANTSIYLAFVSNTNLWNTSNYVSPANSAGNRYMKIYSRDSGIDTKITRLSQVNVPGMYKVSFKIENLTDKSTYINLDFPKMTNNTKIIPYYLGDGSDAPAEVLEGIGVDSKTIKLLREGDENSKVAENNLKNQNTTLNNSVNQMNSIETEYNSDLNAALDDIDLTTDLVQHTGFTNAALWVSAQFNRLVVGTPLELVVTFSLITGLALVLIGKVRG